MKRTAAWLGPFALLAAGCFDEELVRVPTRLDDPVELANREPGPGCCALEAVEVRSGRSEGATLEALHEYAGRRNANYVVVDAFSVEELPGDELVRTRARLFRCPQLVQLAR